MRPRAWAVAAAGVGFFSSLAAAGFVTVGRGQESAEPAAEPAPPDPDRGRRTLLRGLNPRDFRAVDGTMVADLEGGRRAELSLDEGLQRHVAETLQRFDVPFGSLVAIEPATGRVLAYVSHSSANPEVHDLALDPTPPAR